MKRFFLILVLASACIAAYAEQYENPMLNMTVPSGLENGQSYIVLNYKSAQSLRNYPKDDLFAVLDKGANFEIDFRYMVYLGIEAKAGYIVGNKEQFAGLSYTMKTPAFFLNSQVDAQFFSYKDYAMSKYDQNVFYLLSLQSVPLFDDRLVVSADLGYDGFNSRAGLGVGASFEVMHHIRLLAEYYPVLKDAGGNANVGNTGCYSFGLKVDTFGHQFIFKAGNSSDMGTRRMMLGTKTQDVFIGITLMRLIAF